MLTTNPQCLSFPTLTPFYYKDGGGGWLLMNDFSKKYTLNNKIYLLNIKAGFDYDGASIPRICRSIVGDKMSHDIIVGALFHDILYCVHHELFPRKEADKFIRYFIGEYNGTLAKQIAVYDALRMFGGIAWNHQDSPTLKKEDIYKDFLEIKEL